MQNTPHTCTVPFLSLRRVARLGLSAALAVVALAPSPARAEHSYFAWGQAWDHSQNSTQQGVAVALDRRGNVAATGFTYGNSNHPQIYTVKYDGLTGAILWEKTYSNTILNPDDEPASVACDSAGNVIMTGKSYNGSNYDFYTVKYAAIDGHEMWPTAQRFNNVGEDIPVKVVVDANDNVIVAGSSEGTAEHEDYYTIKYAGSNGAVLWQKRYNGTHNGTDKITDLAVDALGEVAVTGVSQLNDSTGNENYFYTIKYDASGTQLWAKSYDTLGNDATGNGVAMDADGNVLVTGTEIASGNYLFHTIKYSSGAGGVLWSQTYTDPVGSITDAAGIAVDGSGNAFIAGTSTLDNFKVTFYTAKYDATNGNKVWEARTDAPGGTDSAAAIKVDGNGNPVVAGTSLNENIEDDFYAIKYDGATGAKLWDQRLNGENDDGEDTLTGLDVDAVGNVVVTGVGKKESGPYFEMLTAKFNRFLLAPGDPITGPGLTSAAVITAFNVPALGDKAQLGAKVTVKDGKKSYSTILEQGNGSGNRALARATVTAPDVAVGTFKTFDDPVISPDGHEAFIAKLSGAPGAEATGVWTDIFTGSLQCALQYGTQVPGLASGVLLKTVTTISARNGCLAALITVKGTGVTGTNSTVLLCMTNKTTGYQVIRTGDSVTIDGATSTIKKLSIFTPAKTSPGQGRYQGDIHLIATATLADKRIALLSGNTTGGFTPIAATQGPADNVITGSQWKTFGPPEAAPNGFYYGALATLEPKLGGVTTKDDTAIVTSVFGTSFDDIADEGGTAPDSNGGTYLTLYDPVSNTQGNYAYLAKAKGGDFGKGLTGLWFGPATAPRLVTRAGAAAPDALGNDGPSTFSTLTNLALPSGTGAGPIFLATVKGGGANGKNNAGLWGQDSGGALRQLLRNGDVLGTQTVKKFVLLNSLAGAMSTARSYNGAGGAAALVSFTDKTNAVVYVGVP